MTKNLQDAKIEELELNVSILLHENAATKKKLKETVAELEEALDEAAAKGLEAETAKMQFNMPLFDLYEAQSEVKELREKLSNIRKTTKAFEKKSLSVLNRFNNRLPEVELVHHFDDDEVEERVKHEVIDVYRLAEYEGFIRTLTEEVKQLAATAEELSKKKVVRGVDAQTFDRTETNVGTARSAIFAYLSSKGLYDVREQFTRSDELMSKALDRWFEYSFNESIEKMSIAKAKKYMSPYYRAERAVIGALREAKMKEYDWRTSN